MTLLPAPLQIVKDALADAFDLSINPVSLRNRSETEAIWTNIDKPGVDPADERSVVTLETYVARPGEDYGYASVTLCYGLAYGGGKDVILRVSTSKVGLRAEMFAKPGVDVEEMEGIADADYRCHGLISGAFLRTLALEQHKVTQNGYTPADTREMREAARFLLQQIPEQPGFSTCRACNGLGYETYGVTQSGAAAKVACSACSGTGKWRGY